MAAGDVRTYPNCAACGWMFTNDEATSQFCEACGNPWVDSWANGEWENVSQEIINALIEPPSAIVLTQLRVLGQPLPGNYNLSWLDTIDDDDMPLVSTIESGLTDPGTFDQNQPSVTNPEYAPYPNGYDAFTPAGSSFDFRMYRTWNPKFVWQDTAGLLGGITQEKLVQTPNDDVGGTMFLIRRLGESSGGTETISLYRASDDTLLSGPGNMANPSAVDYVAWKVYLQEVIAPTPGEEVYCETIYGGETFRHPNFLWDTDLANADQGDYSPTLSLAWNDAP